LAHGWMDRLEKENPDVLKTVVATKAFEFHNCTCVVSVERLPVTVGMSVMPVNVTIPQYDESHTEAFKPMAVTPAGDQVVKAPTVQLTSPQPTGVEVRVGVWE